MPKSVILLSLLAVIVLVRCQGFCPLDGCVDPGGGNAAEGENPYFDAGTGFNGTVEVIRALTNGDLYVGGSFTQYNGTDAGRLVRLHSDGSLDTGFDTATGFNNTVYDIEEVSSGIVVVGAFSAYNGNTIRHIARLTPSGTFDGTLNLAPDQTVFAVEPAPDGSGNLYFAGAFETIGAMSKQRIARVSGAGAVDTSFPIAGGPNNTVRKMDILTAWHRIAIAGDFTNVASAVANRLALLYTDGSAVTGSIFGCNGSVDAIAVLATQSAFLWGGNCTDYEGNAVDGFFLTSSSGNLIPWADLAASVGTRAIEVLNPAKGTLFVAGSFTTWGTVTANRIVRLTSSGGLDTASFDFNNFNSNVNVLEMSRDGTNKLYAAGQFTSVNGVSHGRIVRLHTNGALDTAP
ncbi:MAG: delta-60 repeat domain-containing protein [Bdellovibrionales bacterium]|nr:delta-60 repeat domain-containing protein [Bdellovibrionales bacterium]